ncbi:MAG: hypothetical protein CENE_03467 [Candidatus Celerinatantimonas neptuna]|nr:MAG: hypothetical protein CENE_03467 [Candidatus Celerinatantimonas neptuna]
MEDIKEITSASADVFPVITDNQLPIGAVIMYAGMANEEGIEYLEKNGWLICNGQALKQDLYIELFKVLRGTYGVAGDTFFIPDCRGLFARGVDEDHVNDPDAGERTPQNDGGNKGGNVGTHQEDEFKSHNHQFYVQRNNGSSSRANQSKKNDNWKYENTLDTGGNETRPKNIAFYYIIKFRDEK